MVSNVMLWAIWYHLYNLKKKVKKIHGGALLLEELKPEVYDFTRSNAPRWVSFTFLKLFKWCKITQSVSNNLCPKDDE